MSIQRIHVGKRLSEVVIHNQTIYLAGQVADDTTADIKGQTQQVLSNIDRLLHEAGSDKTKILSAMIILTDVRDFPLMNEVWDTWVPMGDCPARATIEARLASSAYKVEIIVVAAKP